MLILGTSLKMIRIKWERWRKRTPTEVHAGMYTFNNKMITQTHASVRLFFAIARSIERIQFCELQSRLLHLRSSRCTIVSLLCRAVIKDKGVYCNIVDPRKRRTGPDIPDQKSRRYLCISRTCFLRSYRDRVFDGRSGGFPGHVIS